MLKATHEAASFPIRKEELVVAAKDFLEEDESNRDIIFLDNVHSLEFGSSVLLFTDRTNTKLTAMTLNDKGDCETFIISSISYYMWLKQLITVGESFFHGKRELEMYLFSDDFSPVICYLMDSLSKEFKFYLVKYKILHVEGLDEPAIYFQHVTHRDSPKRKLVKTMRQEEDPVSMKESPAAVKISSEELGEFNRLKDLYLA